jgi:hypothetical protein
MTNRQKWTITLVPALLLAAIVLPMALAWSELPDSMATHWGFDGTPNGHMPPSTLLLAIGGIFAAVWLGVWGASRRMPFEARSFIAGLVGIGGLLAAVQWFAVDLNRDVADWTDAGEFNGTHLVAVLAAALVLGAIGWLLAGSAAMTDESLSDHSGPILHLEPGASAIWSGRGRGIVLIVVGIGLLIAAIAVWSVVSLVLLLVALLVMVFSEVRATVSDAGVAVSLGWLGIPSWLVPLNTITGAEVEDVSPMSYGGWGYRVRPGVRGVIVRGGPSLRLRRKDRPDLVLTVDDAERGAGLVNALVARI